MGRASDATLYFDFGSPYAYLAVARVELVLGFVPSLEPILLGAIFGLRGRGSWSAEPQREARMQEVQARAQSYGLPPLNWPAGWPVNGLSAMRAATWAKRQGRVADFTRAVFHHEFALGEDITDFDVLRACADAAGLDSGELEPAVASGGIKAELRAATEAAWSAGVRGVPSVRVGGRVFYGDDALPSARSLDAPEERGDSI